MQMSQWHLLEIRNQGVIPCNVHIPLHLMESSLKTNALDFLGVQEHERVSYFLCSSSQRALADRCKVCVLTSNDPKIWSVMD